MIVLCGIYMTSTTEICAATNPNRLDTLKTFAQKKILYDEYVPLDSVISWSEDILPDIKQNNKDRETYFLLQLQLANAYTLRGDISLAITKPSATPTP